MKQMGAAVPENLVVGYWKLVPIESGADKSSEQETATVTKELEETPVKQKRTFCWKEENWTRPKKSLERRRNLEVNGVCDAACLELGKNPVPPMTVINCLQRIGSKPITYKNALPPRNQ